MRAATIVRTSINKRIAALSPVAEPPLIGETPEHEDNGDGTSSAEMEREREGGRGAEDEHGESV
ncbi:hypothetical protein SAY86_021799 [Trapa natans]|uniref:Uncharacterized protein n=1 Tax=Trapa natans TaxID=22666 RepID=A0AAN7MAK3_TRANT|nr:hypothetical protein SAY86_021799 [Trapa natans]